MPTSYLPYAPDQQLLLPHSLQEWLPQGHLAHYINDTIDTLDLSAFFKRYQGGGSRNQPFHPAMMVKVLVYAYATGMFRSRKIERRLHEDLAFRMLAAGNFPRHRTTSPPQVAHRPPDRSTVTAATPRARSRAASAVQKNVQDSP